jgi:hypothetical protein
MRDYERRGMTAIGCAACGAGRGSWINAWHGACSRKSNSLNSHAIGFFGAGEMISPLCAKRNTIDALRQKSTTRRGTSIAFEYKFCVMRVSGIDDSPFLLVAAQTLEWDQCLLLPTDQ